MNYMSTVHAGEYTEPLKNYTNGFAANYAITYSTYAEYPGLTGCGPPSSQPPVDRTRHYNALELVCLVGIAMPVHNLIGSTPSINLPKPYLPSSI